MMELESTRIFVKVVQLGSFSKAAALLSLPKSTVSRTVTRLETETGTKLLLRTTRSLSLTAAGQAFYESCLGPVRAIEDARRSIQGRDSIIAGTVKLTTVEDLGTHVLSRVLGKLLSQHPELSIEFNYTDEIVDLVREGYDLAIRIGKLNPSSFRTIRLGEIAILPVASPTYLARKPKIREPKDLANHDCLTISPETAKARWTLCSRGRTVAVPIKARAIGNQMTGLVQMATQGAGIALVSSFLCQKELKEGQLVRVLPEWSVRGYPVSLVSPNPSGSSARVKLVAETLATEIKTILANVT